MTNIVFWLGLALSIISGAYKYLTNNNTDNNIITSSEKQETNNGN